MVIALGVLSFLLALVVIVIIALWRALVRVYWYWMDAEEELELLRGGAPPIDILIAEGGKVAYRAWLN